MLSLLEGLNPFPQITQELYLEEKCTWQNCRTTIQNRAATGRVIRI